MHSHQIPRETRAVARPRAPQLHAHPSCPPESKHALAQPSSVRQSSAAQMPCKPATPGPCATQEWPQLSTALHCTALHAAAHPDGHHVYITDSGDPQPQAGMSHTPDVGQKAHAARALLLTCAGAKPVAPGSRLKREPSSLCSRNFTLLRQVRGPG